MSERMSRLEYRPHALPRYSPVGSKLSVKPNEPSQPTVYVPPLAGDPLLNVPGYEPVELEELEELELPVEPELDFFLLPQPAANTTSTAMRPAVVAYRSIFLTRCSPFWGVLASKLTVRTSRRMRRANRHRAG